jgi:DNA-binding transcriptional ArsR family regulator
MSRASAKKKDERLDAVFHALADTTRRRIVDRLAHGPTSVGELASPFSISLAAISKHLDVLEGAGVVRREREGRFQRCQLAPEGLEEVSRFIDHYRGFWKDTLDQLAEYLEGQPPPRRRRGRTDR